MKRERTFAVDADRAVAPAALPFTAKREDLPDATARATTDSYRAKKPSYLVKRAERSALAADAHVLEEQLDALRRRVGLPTREDTAAIDRARALHFDLEEHLHQNDLYLGRLHSMATNDLLLPSVNPLSTFIHLPTRMKERRDILRGMQDQKLRRGVECATQRLHYVDHTVPYLSEERFTTATGEYHCHRLEINQFPNFQTARQLFDTFVNFLYNMEISVTEGLGQMTLREDTDELADPTIWNHRIVTVADDVGCTEELNSVGFARFYPHSSYTNSPMGIIVYDTVNVDDLYPYLPDQRTCKDVQAAHMVFELPKPGCPNETIVVLKQCLFCVQLPPQFELSPGALKQLQDNSTRWCAYLIKYLREYIVTDTIC